MSYTTIKNPTLVAISSTTPTLIVDASDGVKRIGARLHNPQSQNLYVVELTDGETAPTKAEMVTNGERDWVLGENDTLEIGSRNCDVYAVYESSDANGYTKSIIS
jgi:hypothetical protein